MTTLIKNILLVDGTSKPFARADVLVKNERIAAVGSFSNYKAGETIDGLGVTYLAPGFIDINTASDRYLTLFNNPSQQSFLLQGVTTIIGGQNGVSLAPLLYGSLELKKLWIDTRKTNIDWHTVREYLEAMSKKRFGVNYGTLAGHTTIREAIAGDDFRDLTQKEVDVFRLVLERALAEGAYGISIDLTFPLTALTPYKELRAILETVAAKKGLCSIKIRDNRENILVSVAEVINLSRETGVKVHLNNFFVPNGFESDYEKALELISESASTADIHFNLHPFNVSVLPLFSLLPPWARRGGLMEIRDNFRNSSTKANIKADLPKMRADDVVIFHAPGHQYLNGQTLRSFSNNRGLNLKDGLMALMDLLDLRGSVVYRDISTKKLAKALLHDGAVISSGSSSFDVERFNYVPEHSSKTFSKYLEIVFSKKKFLPLEAAISKITSTPAKELGLKNRGLVKENYFADLVMFRDSKIENVWVNGKVAVRDGKFTGTLEGRIIKKEL